MMQNFAVNKKLENLHSFEASNMAVMKIQDKVSVMHKIDQLRFDSSIEYVQPNYIYRFASNDSLSGSLWGLPMIEWEQALWVFSGTVSLVTGTIVAVIDEWVAYNHPDLINKMWSGSDCKDDNWASLGACLHGYDFMDNDSNPMGHIGSHGTHVAWTIAAQMNNGVGIVWVNPQAKIMTLRAGENGYLVTSSIIRSINFAKYNWAKIINASFGWPSYDLATRDAIESFPWLFVVAAGNSSVNNDTTAIYPCNYTWTNIICVAASDQSDVLAWFSNYWNVSVDVAAPGVNILSTVKTSSVWYSNVFESSLWSFVSWWSDSSWLWSGGAGRWDRALASGYVTGIQDSFMVNSSDLSSFVWAKLSFAIICDTPAMSSLTGDYIKLSLTSWSVFYDLVRINELYGRVNTWINVDWLDYVWATSGNFYIDSFVFDISSYISSGFGLKFHRYSDETYDQATLSNQWCSIDNISIVWYDGGEWGSYTSYNGTSMATPHVAWLASLARSMRPELSFLEIKNVLIWSWDNLASLSWKVVSW